MRIARPRDPYGLLLYCYLAVVPASPPEPYVTCRFTLSGRMGWPRGPCLLTSVHLVALTERPRGAYGLSYRYPTRYTTIPAEPCMARAGNPIRIRATRGVGRRVIIQALLTSRTGLGRRL